MYPQHVFPAYLLEPSACSMRGDSESSVASSESAKEPSENFRPACIVALVLAHVTDEALSTEMNDGRRRARRNLELPPRVAGNAEDHS